MTGIVRRVHTAVAMVALLSVLGVAGAGAGAADDGRELLRQGMLALAGSPGLTATFSLDTDVASLQALFDEDGETLTHQAAEVVRGTSLQVTFPVAVPGDWFAMSVRSAGIDWAELRVVDGVLYGRADLRTWVELLGADPALLDQLRAELERDGVLPPDTLEGRWIAITEPDGVVQAAAEQENALGRLGNALIDSAEVELVGTDEQGDRLRVVVSPRTLRDVLALELSALTPGGAADWGLPPSQNVPDVPVELDLWVRDGFLVAARLDLMQLGALGPDYEQPPGVERLALLLQFRSFEGSVPAPADAVTVDGDKVLDMLLPHEPPYDPGDGDGVVDPDLPGDGGTVWADPDSRLPRVPRDVPRVSTPGAGGDAKASAPLSLNALLGVDLSRTPRARPAANGFPDAITPDPALMHFYSRPGYGEARRRYCLQLDDVSDEVWARHYADICPGSNAGALAAA